LLTAIADQEGIEVTEAELDALADADIEFIAPADRARLKDDRELRERIAHDIRLDRALQKLLDIVQNTEQGD